MPSWLAPLLARQDRGTASVELTRCFLAASPPQRRAVAEGWPFEAEWPYPDPARLGCRVGEAVAAKDRIITSLVLDYLVGAFGSPEQAIAFSASYRACELAGLNPEAVFECVARALPTDAAENLRVFLREPRAARAPERFGLVEQLNDDGEIELVRAL